MPKRPAPIQAPQSNGFVKSTGGSDGKYKMSTRQVRILLYLAKFVGGLTRKDIQEGLPIQASMTNTLGSLKKGHKDTGFPSLIDLGYVRALPINDDGKKEVLFECTDLGREMAKTLDES